MEIPNFVHQAAHDYDMPLNVAISVYKEYGSKFYEGMEIELTSRRNS